MSTIQGLHPITPDAAKWRDLSSREVMKERCIRITLAACALILASGLVVGVYFVAAEFSASGFSTIKFLHLLKGFSVLPIGIGLTTYGAIVYDKEHAKYGVSSNLSDSVIRDTHLNRIRQADLSSLYSEYREKKSGGLGPLVRKGILSVEEGTCLRRLFSEYAPYHEARKLYNSSSLLANAIEERSDTVLGFQTVEQAIARLSADWEGVKNGQIIEEMRTSEKKIKGSRLVWLAEAKELLTRGEILKVCEQFSSQELKSLVKEGVLTEEQKDRLKRLYQRLEPIKLMKAYEAEPALQGTLETNENYLRAKQEAEWVNEEWLELRGQILQNFDHLSLINSGC